MDRNRRGPVERERPLRRGFRGTVENSKTKICMRWQNGECRFGDRCNFAHGEDELRQLPPRAGESGGRSPRSEGDSAIRNSAVRSQVARGGNVPAAGTFRPSNGREHNAWVASGCPIRGPNGWTQYKTEDGEKYYHNSDTNITQWDPPAEWKGPV